MSRWHTEYEKHPIHQKIGSLHTLLTEKQFVVTEHEIEQEIARFKKVIELIKTVLSHSDYEYITQTQLDQLLSFLDSAESHFNSFKTNSDKSQLTTANNHLDRTFDLLATISSIASLNTISTGISINSFIERGEDFLVEMERHKNKLQQQIKELSQTFSSLHSKVQSLEQQVETKTAELNQLSTNWTSQFNTAQTQKEERFNTKLSEIEQSASTRTNEIIEILHTETSKKQVSYENIIEDIITDAKKQHQKVKTLHGLVANDSTAAGYKGSADNETKAANFWRGAAILFAVCAALWLGYLFWKAEEVDWKTSLNGLPITFILLSMAGYVSHQSSLHREQANKQRQFALEMQAIDPYLENLGDEERRKIKTDLSKKYFGQIQNPEKRISSEGAGLLSVSQMEKLIKALTNK